MAFPIIPIVSQLANAQVLRGLTWNVKRAPLYNNIVHESSNGHRISVAQYTNPLWQWEWMWGYLKNNPFDIQSATSPYTDLKVLEAFYQYTLGQSGEFLYAPSDSVFGGSAAVTSVAIASNVATLLVNNSYQPGMWASFTGLTGGSFLNGKSAQLLATTPTSISFAFTHANYGPAADSGTAIAGSLLLHPDAGNNTELTHMLGGIPAAYAPGGIALLVSESVQELNGAFPVIYVNGTAKFRGTDYNFSGPSTVAPYDGCVITWTGYAVQPTDVIVAAYTYFYHCVFAEDSLDFENFLYNLWQLKSLKFKQIRI
jgi:hypothetical protein